MSFSNPLNWSSIDSKTINAVKITSPDGVESYIPINPQTIAVMTESSAVAIYVSTPSPKSTWKHGGFLGVNIFTGLAGQGGLCEISRHDLPLNKSKVIIIPSYSANKSFTFFVPKWFKAVFWEIWEYTGTDPQDNIGKLDNILSLISTP